MFGVLVTGAKVSGIILYKNTTQNTDALLFFLLFGNYSRDHRSGDKHGSRGDYYNICCRRYVSRSGIHRSQECKRHGRCPLSVLILGNTAQRLPHRCAVRFYVRLYKNFAGILAYVKKFWCNMTKNMQADVRQRLQPLFVRYCLYYTMFPQKFQQLSRKCPYMTFCKKSKSFCKIYLTNSKIYDIICSERDKNCFRRRYGGKKFKTKVGTCGYGYVPAGAGGKGRGLPPDHKRH